MCEQYTRTAGHPALVQLLAERYGRHFGRKVDAMGEVAVTVGASQVGGWRNGGAVESRDGWMVVAVDKC